MSAFDQLIIVAYLAAMIGLSFWVGRGQKTEEDYYVGGRNLPWWALGISTMATQTSVVSFVSIPAFVAVKEHGGLTWLQYELAVPIAMLLVCVFLLPFFRELELVSVYAYLEKRFSPSVRYFLSAVFLLSRGLGTGVGVYASALVLEVCLGLPLWQTIVLIGVVTVIYDTIGGMAAVVYSDVVQMVVLLLGLGACIYFAADAVGGAGAVIQGLEPARWRAFDPSTGLGDNGRAPFWGFLVGGLFLYVSYYGVDQSQAQRALSAPTEADTRRAVIFNGLARFPLTLLYLALGIALASVYEKSAPLRATVDKPDALVPQFVLQYLPGGLKAVLFAAMLAAAMSSLDSALNSLSAATMQDFVERLWPLSDDNRLKASKLTTVIWGALITAAAFLFGGQDTVVEVINKVGSAFYGPILAAFLMGLLSRRANSTGVLVGVVAGVAVNMTLWLTGAPVFWMWWNAIGLVVSAAVTLGVSAMTAPPRPEQLEGYTLGLSGLWAREKKWWWAHGLLILYFFVILACILTVDGIAR